jgi:hypothetical protein
LEGPWACAVGHDSVVLYVNYFGFPASATAEDLAQQQHDRGAVIVFDMTHSLFNTAPDEMSNSDYAVGSLRKWIGLPDGGLAWKRGCRFSMPLDTDSTDGGFGRVRLVAGLMKGLYCDSILSQKDGYRTLFGIAEGLAERCTVAAPVSRNSRALWSQLDAAAVVSARRTNYAALASGISQLQFIHLFEEALPQDVCPLGCPVLSSYRDDLRAFLTNHSVYCPIHWQLPAGIKAGFPTSQSVSARILTLPCDQRYTTSDMNKIVTLLAEWDESHRCDRDGDEV